MTQNMLEISFKSLSLRIKFCLFDVFFNYCKHYTYVTGHILSILKVENLLDLLW